MPLGTDADLFVTIPRGQYDNLIANAELMDPIRAPIQKGQKLGHIKIRLQDREIATHDLIAMQSIDKGGLWVKLTSSVGLTFHRLFHKFI